MSFRDKVRKLKSDAKSRILQASESNANTGTNEPAITVSSIPRNWRYLRAFLSPLKQATDSFPPLRAAVAEFAECICTYEDVLHTRKEYKVLHKEIEGLLQVLYGQFAQNNLPAMTAAMESLCKYLKDEAKGLHQKQYKGKLRECTETDQDLVDILASYRRIQGYLQRISLNANMSIWRVVDEITTDNRLKNLLPSLSARYNSGEAVKLKRGSCTEGTRVDLRCQIHDWVENSGIGSVYWMSGMAGTGKTTIVYSLCEELDAQHKLAASFFCSRLLPGCRDVNLVIPTIAYQLARSSHPFRSVLSKILEKDPDIHTSLPHLQFEALIANPLLEIKETLPDNLVVVIDALDECENKESTHRILDALLARSAGLPVKFILSSRPEPEIRDEMTKQSNQAKSRVVLHELDKDVVQADIETYLRAALSPAQPSEEQISTLVKRAGILFIYAATVVRYVGYDRFGRNPSTRLANVLNSARLRGNKAHEIDDLYKTVLQAALDDPRLDEEEKEDVRQVLHTVICAQEPLPIDALSNLLRMNDTKRVRAALRPLWSILHISGPNEVATTLHASFSDYMFDSSRSGEYCCYREIHNQTMALRCFDTFRDTRPQFNICNLNSSFIPDDQVEGLEERVRNAVSTELFYASRYWAVHLHSAIGTPDLISELEEFLSLRLLLWMEVMNLKKCTAAMPPAIRLIEKWRTEVSIDLKSLTHDAWRFTSTFSLAGLSASTPHIYMSMLPFWPKSTPITRNYSRCAQRMVRLEGTAIIQQQHAHLATWGLENLSFSCAISPDSTQVAVGVGCEILLLNSLTGQTLLPPFRGHRGFVNCVDFSSDGTRIVSGSEDGTIRIWDTRSGELVPTGCDPATSRIYISIGNPIHCVAFSPDSAQIAIGTFRGGVHIWDARNGRIPRQLPIPPQSPGCEYVKSIKYSSKGRYIVACVLGYDYIPVWDIRAGHYFKVLRSVDTPCSFLFADISSDDIHVVSGSDKGILIWDLGTGKIVLGPLVAPCADTSLELVSFSSDGLHVASGSRHGTICVWDVRTGNLVLGPIEGHIGRVTSACFSPDGTYLISSSIDRTLCLWDVQAMRGSPPLEGHTASVTLVRYSPNGAHIASGSEDRTVCLWDAGSGKMTCGPLELYLRGGVQVEFSPDSARIISATSHKVLLLDAKTGNVLLDSPYNRSHKLINSVAFTQDGTPIMASSGYGKTQVLTVDTSQTFASIQLPHTNNGNPEPITVIFSPDRTRVAVCNHGLRIYDTYSGQLLFGPLDARLDHFHAMGLSPDNRHIVYSTLLESLVVGDMQGGKKIIESIETHQSRQRSYSVEFSPDGSRIVSNSRDNGICIWDTQTGLLLLGPLKGHTKPITVAKFSPDGTRVVSGSYDKTIRVTDVTVQPVPATSIQTSSKQDFREWEMRDDGWVVDGQSRLLVWIPGDLRTVLMWPRTKLLISRKGYLRLNFDGAYLGELWTKCYRPIHSD